MFEGLKRKWEEFKSGTPGERFQERYEQTSSERGRFSRGVRIVVGVVIFAAGIFFLPAPGPGMVIVVIGAFMIAEQWSAAAKALDWAELKIRAVLGWMLRVWKASPLIVKGLIVVVAAAIAASFAYGSYQLLFGS